MKKIADIPYETKEDDSLDDPIYAGGIIVKLTKAEALTISKLQDAIDGKGWDFLNIGDVGLGYTNFREEELSHVFQIIRQFVTMKFHINSMATLVERMDDYLMALEGSKESESDEKTQ